MENAEGGMQKGSVLRTRHLRMIRERFEVPLPPGQHPSPEHSAACDFARANGACQVVAMLDLVKARWSSRPPSDIEERLLRYGFHWWRELGWSIKELPRAGNPPTELHTEAWDFARKLGARHVQFGCNSIRVSWPDRQEPPNANPPAGRKAAIRRERRTGLRWDQDRGRWVITDSAERALEQNGFRWDDGHKQWIKVFPELGRRRSTR